jgi:hypothetical protein
MQVVVAVEHGAAFPLAQHRSAVAQVQTLGLFLVLMEQ